jgi:hypothetical protein
MMYPLKNLSSASSDYLSNLLNRCGLFYLIHRVWTEPDFLQLQSQLVTPLLCAEQPKRLMVCSPSVCLCCRGQKNRLGSLADILADKNLDTTRLLSHCSSPGQHLWVGPRNIERNNFFRTVSPKRKHQISIKEREAAPGNAQRVLFRCANLRSLALYRPLTVGHGLAPYQFQLTEFISTGDRGGFRWAACSSVRTIKRGYLVTQYGDWCTGDPISNLPSLDTLEIIWLDEPDLRTMQRVIEFALYSKVVHLVKVRSDKVLLDAMCAMMPKDARFALEDFVAPAQRKDSGFLMDEWEERIRRLEYWETSTPSTDIPQL